MVKIWTAQHGSGTHTHTHKKRIEYERNGREEREA